jgi:NSS family neurotransmitter:Na+ symporter
MSHVREHWGSKLGFILAAIGSAVGLGVLWMFPYVVGQNGGGLFLFAYILCVILIGIPVFIGELILGRSSQRASIGAFEVLCPEKPAWKIAGVFGALASFIIMSFYSVVAGWGISYIMISLSGFYEVHSILSAAQVFKNLSSSGSITILWHFVFVAMTMGIVLSGVRKGIEFWAKIITRVLFALLIGLFLYSLTLEGFPEAIRFIFYPNFQNFKPSSILEALGLAFFTLSLGQGIMISYGSYMRKTENIPQMALIVSGSVIVVAILTAFTIFPVVFTFGFSPSSGPGLVFETLPHLFTKLPGSTVLSTVFFTLFVFTALTSSVPFIEVVSTNLMEIQGFSRKKATLLSSASAFIFGIPSALAGSGSLFGNWPAIYGLDFLATMNQFVSVWLIPIGGLLTAIFLGWRLDQDILKRGFNDGSSWIKIYRIWIFFMKYLIPVLIFLIILQKSELINFDQMISTYLSSK